MNIESEISGRRAWIVWDGGMAKAATVHSLNVYENGNAAYSDAVGEYDICPIDIEKLRQNIRDGKLDPRDLQTFGGVFLSAADAETREDCDELAAFFFLVRDGKGNVKLCNADGFIASILGGEFRTGCRDFRIDRAAAGERYVLLRLGDALKNAGEDR